MGSVRDGGAAEEGGREVLQDGLFLREIQNPNRATGYFQVSSFQPLNILISELLHTYAVMSLYILLLVNNTSVLYYITHTFFPPSKRALIILGMVSKCGLFRPRYVIQNSTVK